MEKTSTGLSENVAGVLCYILIFISGIVFLVIEPENKTVRFHAFQSIIVFSALFVISLIFNPIPLVGWAITWLASLIGFVLWIYLIVMASQGKKYKLRWAGNLAEKWAGGTES